MAVLARDLRENADGTLDIFGIFEGITTDIVPVSAPHMTLVVSLSASLAEVGIRRPINIELWAEDGPKIVTHSEAFVVPESRYSGSRSFFTLRFPLEGVPFLQVGRYSFHIEIGDDDKRDVPIHVSLDEGLIQ